MVHLRVCVKFISWVRHLTDVLRYALQPILVSFSFAEYSTILIFVTYNAYQMQIQTSCLYPHVELFLFLITTKKTTYSARA